MKIVTKKDLANAIATLKHFKEKRAKYERLVTKYNDAILRFFETNNRKRFVDEDGMEWQKRQGTTQIYDISALRKLLKKRGINYDLVVKRTLVESVDEQEVFKLMKEGTLSIEDIERVSILKQHKPYLTSVKHKESDEES